MVKEPTVLILGAGASRPYGLPTGEELVHIIRIGHPGLDNFMETLHNTNYISGILRRYTDFKKALFTLSSESVTLDNFIESRDFDEIGKLCIAYLIHSLENRTSLFQVPADSREYNWYPTLWKILDCDSFQEFETQPLRIYTFNYDLTLDYFFHENILNRFKKNIYSMEFPLMPRHIYGIRGIVGENAFSQYLVDDKAAFNEPPSLQVFASNSLNRIHLIHDEKTTDYFRQINQDVLNYRKVYFLGFGYDNANTKRFDINAWSASGVQINGTALNSNKKEITQLLRRFNAQQNRDDAFGDGYVEKVAFYPVDCNKFLRESVDL